MTWGDLLKSCAGVDPTHWVAWSEFTKSLSCSGVCLQKKSVAEELSGHCELRGLQAQVSHNTNSPPQKATPPR